MPDSSLLHDPPAEIRVEARLTPDQRARRDTFVQTVHDYQAKSLEAAEALAAIKDERLYAEDGTFADFARKHFGIGRSHAYNLAKAGRLFAALDKAGVSPLPRSEAQLRPLTKLEAFDAQRDAWLRAVGDGEADAVTMDDVLAVVRVELGEANHDHADAAAEELRRMAPDELEVGRLLRRLREGATDGEFERLVRDEVGRSAAWAETAMAYAEQCDELEEGERPTVAAFERYRPSLSSLALEDRTAVWKRLAKGAGGGSRPYGSHSYGSRAVATAVREVMAAGLDELGLEPLSSTGGPEVEGPEEDAGGGPEAATLVVHLDADLLSDVGDGGEFRTRIEAEGERVAPATYGLPYDALSEGAMGAAIDTVVEAMRTGRDMPEERSVEQQRLVLGQRQMVRVGFEPDLATWAWPVLTPAPMRFPRTWLPGAAGPGTGDPCFVPRRLLQPLVTKRRTLSARDRAKREAGAYLVDDDERHQSRVVLLAPGVDLTHPAVPEAVVRRVLDHAEEAVGLVFLPLALDVDRLAAFDWPANVRPVAVAATADEVARSVAAFAGADARGVVVLRDGGEELPVGALDEDQLRGHLAAVLVRGKGTTRRALQSALALRRYGVRVQVGRDVTVREVEPVFDPAELDSAGTEEARDRPDGEAQPATKPARLPAAKPGKPARGAPPAPPQ